MYFTGPVFLLMIAFSELELVEVPLFGLAGINKKSAWSLLHRDWFSNLSLYSISQIIELLYVKHIYADLPLFSESEIDCFIEHLCTFMYCLGFILLFSFFLFYLCTLVPSSC